MAVLTALMFLALLRQVPHLPWEPASPRPEVSASPTVEAPAERSTLRIGVAERPASLPLYTLKEDHELHVEIIEIPDEAERWAQLAGGRLDVAQGTMPSYALALSRLRAGNYLCSLGNDVGEEALVGGHDVKEIGDLKDKAVAVPEGGTGEYLLAGFLDQANLSLSQTTVVLVATSADALDLLKRGKVQAALLALPALSSRPADSTLLAATEEGKDPHVEEVLAVRRNLPASLQSRLPALMHDYFQFVEDMKVHKGLQRDKIYRNTGIPSDTLADELKTVQFATIADNRAMDVPGITKEMSDVQHVLNLIGAPNAAQLPNLEEYISLDWMAGESP